MTTLFGGKVKNLAQQIAPPPVEDKGQGDAKRKLGRASLYMTSPQGDLSQANTASGKLLS